MRISTLIGMFVWDVADVDCLRRYLGLWGLGRVLFWLVPCYLRHGVLRRDIFELRRRVYFKFSGVDWGFEYIVAFALMDTGCSLKFY
jgi:hypothetical protein